MSSTPSAPSTPSATSPSPTASPTVGRVFAALVGLASLVVLLQGLWAGLFIHEGRDYQDNWVEVHARGADVAIILSAIAFVLALVKLRARRDLVIGVGAMTVLLVLEAYLGGLIGDSPRMTVVHIPLAMALMGLSVWLPLRSRALR